MNRVAAVIVTYNRLRLLKECINAIKQQRNQKCDIIVVNNGSSDGTLEWLNLQKDIKVIHQENLGGAGGFYTGMKVAVEDGYEWLWMMDDDGKPEELQLYYLLTASQEKILKLVNALVVDEECKDKLAFGFNYQGRSYSYVKELEAYEVFPQINPFNGTLIHRDVIKRIGYVKKEMFIWGDEQEYTFRAIRNGFAIATITKAIHYHPHNKGRKENIIPYINNWKVIIKPDHLSHIYFRNLGYIHKTYNGLSIVIKTIAKYSAYYLFRFKLRKTKRFISYYIKGVKNIF